MGRVITSTERGGLVWIPRSNGPSPTAPMAGSGRGAGQDAGPEPGKKIGLEIVATEPGYRTFTTAAPLLARPETGSLQPVRKAKSVANSAGPDPDSAREFEILPEAASGFSVNHVQVENCESDQWEDSVRESSSGCSSDRASGPRAFAKASASCSAGDSRNPGEGILRTRNSGIGSGLALPTNGRPKDFHVAPILRPGPSNSKVIESCQRMRGAAGANRHRAVARQADGGLALTNGWVRVARQGRAGGPTDGVPQGRSGGGWSAGWNGRREDNPRSDLGSDRQRDPGGLENANSGANPGTISGSISAPHSEVNTRSAGAEIQGEIGRAVRFEIQTSDAQFRAGDRRSAVAESVVAGPLIRRPDLCLGGPAGAFACRKADGIGCDADGNIARGNDRWFAIGVPASAALAAPGGIRTGESTRRSADWEAAPAAVPPAVGAISARACAPLLASFVSECAADGPTDSCLPCIRMANSSGFSAETAPENTPGIRPDHLPADPAGCENIHAGKHADKNRPVSTMPRVVVPDRVNEQNDADFSHGVACADSFGEYAAGVSEFESIRETKHPGNFGQFVESRCAAALIRACDRAFSNFHDTSRSGEISPALSSAFAPIRKTEHVSISSPNAKSSCAACVHAPFGEADFFETLKLNGFSKLSAALRKHIRRGELFAASCLNARSRCLAGASGVFDGGAIFGRLKLRKFFDRTSESEKHIRRGEVFDTSCPELQNTALLGSRSAPYQSARKLFIFSEFSGILPDSFGTSIHIRKAKLPGISGSGAPREFSGVCASEGFAARAFSAVNSGECLTEINPEKLPGFSKVISRPASSESITGINAGTLPDLAIPDLSESITGINAQSSRESAPINSRDSFTGINVRFGDSPFEETRLADSSIRAFPIRARPHTGRVPARRRESHPDTAATPRHQDRFHDGRQIRIPR